MPPIYLETVSIVCPDCGLPAEGKRFTGEIQVKATFRTGEPPIGIPVNPLLFAYCERHIDGELQELRRRKGPQAGPEQLINHKTARFESMRQVFEAFRLWLYYERDGHTFDNEWQRAKLDEIEAFLAPTSEQVEIQVNGEKVAGFAAGLRPEGDACEQGYEFLTFKTELCGSIAERIADVCKVCELDPWKEFPELCNVARFEMPEGWQEIHAELRASLARRLEEIRPKLATAGDHNAIRVLKAEVIAWWREQELNGLIYDSAAELAAKTEITRDPNDRNRISVRFPPFEFARHRNLEQQAQDDCRPSKSLSESIAEWASRVSSASTSSTDTIGAVAQPEVPRSSKPQVAGSSPSGATISQAVEGSERVEVVVHDLLHGNSWPFPQPETHGVDVIGAGGKVLGTMEMPGPDPTAGTPVYGHDGKVQGFKGPFPPDEVPQVEVCFPFFQHGDPDVLGCVARVLDEHARMEDSAPLRAAFVDLAECYRCALAEIEQLRAAPRLEAAESALKAAESAHEQTKRELKAALFDVHQLRQRVHYLRERSALEAMKHNASIAPLLQAACNAHAMRPVVIHVDGAVLPQTLADNLPKVEELQRELAAARQENQEMRDEIEGLREGDDAKDGA